MNYPPGAQYDSRAPWNEVAAMEHKFDIEGFVSSHDSNDVHKVKITGVWIEVNGRKCVESFKYSYPDGKPAKKPADPDYEVREAISAELGQRVDFNL
jgi:hypothetical protein